jgi:predicted AAA+ superfamily ATPase
VATGSSSLQIKAKFSDSLAGRKHVYRVDPLNFDEFLVFRGEERLLDLRRDAGTLYETYVFNTLSQEQDLTSSLYFYRTQSKSEIDFVMANSLESKLF